MREIRLSGSVEGVVSNHDPYSDVSKLLMFFPLPLNMERALFASDRWQEAADLVERALEANGDDYNVYVPYGNAPAALGRTEATRTLIERALTVLEQQIE